MRRAAAGFALLAALALGACAPSVHPVVTDKDLVFNEKLLGTWVSGDGKTVWTVARGGETFYTVVYASEGKSGTFKGRLAGVGNILVFDLTPEPGNLDAVDGLSKTHLLPLHTVNRLWIVSDDEVHYATLSAKWFKALIERRALAEGFERIGDGILLTLDTPELRRLIEREAQVPEAFPDRTVLRRQKGGE